MLLTIKRQQTTLKKCSSIEYVSENLIFVKKKETPNAAQTNLYCCIAGFVLALILQFI